jgi:hypothetical protein
MASPGVELIASPTRFLTVSISVEGTPDSPIAIKPPGGQAEAGYVKNIEMAKTTLPLIRAYLRRILRRTP